MGNRIDNRNFDYVLPVHVDVDQISEVNKTCIYISGNVNPYVYSKNTSGKLTKVLGGPYNYQSLASAEEEPELATVKEERRPCSTPKGGVTTSEQIIADRTLLGNGANSVVTTTLIGPTPNVQMFSKGIESPQLNIRIKNIQGFRDDREKTLEEIVVKNLEQIIDQGMYKFQQFHIRIQIIRESSYVLSSIINSIILNFIYNNISLNFVVNSINVGIVDRSKYGAYVAEQDRVKVGMVSEGPGNVNNPRVFSNDEVTTPPYADKLFYADQQTYIPKIILDPLDEEVDLYCSSAFCFIVAPEFQKVISNIVIKNSVGMSSELFTLSKWYACEVSRHLHSGIRRSYASHLKRLETCLESNYL
ncbi:conserved Plasmodium protein, unknown function [Plasmodium knowlesi strain H]|uniref:Uncharacterized protein n=3 Tax=Plasmodium knowlesi TaxID=5850 RepID=A0A5K1UE22_PLAKH|nr:conserved Plasmodium protein, unknown function [Plasmodium knowlesi strain H]OTN68450.1 Uncharacterized protein PKNOH_S02302700 [Plasmodium knowlesi]CAA9986528.1 conserved Plasmodium protein, unknown function [Plasmodium knowlesi strain H]SBO24208.1 conserved Plasmodium protein, unknown function [Plasmodium knowlesi strain H]SBO29775.1 conserved Plasmodium protein, unknown function [Plasmodium knowlesi strain H]VVS76002.1 conserved Plasmodium protein, unknown function [Plasmodium knowlesi s|eukprot:XP_002261079.1 hypothetical protein, conserved in Plasmodium species [Plasmodium knowlesi strain H]